ncbi:MAG: bifunctional glycosyltransferase/class I SAM-dependent methyltransferase [Actinomycetota bacterium]|nr:bifunctional glycosyltransferase/class I SAM-dependent methyltransferase [Actinomycetota bacterium]
MSGLSILMPVYNERATLEAAVEQVLLTEYPVDELELIVVDDGSTDGTSELIAAREWPAGVRLLSHERNRGKGAALRTGVAVASMPYTAVMDADLEYDPGDLATLLEPILSGEAEVVFGIRGFASHSAFSFWYVMGNRGVTLACNLLYNCWLADIMTCHKVMPTSVFASLDLRASGFTIEPEITARLLTGGHRIYEVPITYRARGRDEGKKLTAADGVRVVGTLLRCRVQRARVGRTAPLSEPAATSEPGAEDGLWDLERLAAAEGLSDWMFSRFSAHARGTVAEVGAGIGTYSTRLLDAGVQRLLAIEPEPGCAEALERRVGADPRVTVARETLPDSPSLAQLAGSCDLVVCQNVLEHIDDDAAAVKAMAAALAPGGRMTLLVPAHPRLYGRLDRRYGHFRRYDRDRLEHLVDGAGLQLLELRWFNALGVPGWWVKNRAGQPRLDERSMRVYEALLRFWPALEERLRPPFGLSLIAQAAPRTPSAG